MNHDGWRGTLVISDSKVDCATSAWCHLVLKYLDVQGKQITGKIDKIDQKFQHMTFSLNFPNNRQKFDAYVFSWDKKKWQESHTGRENIWSLGNEAINPSV